jgi:hypothetical protein
VAGDGKNFSRKASVFQFYVPLSGVLFTFQVLNSGKINTYFDKFTENTAHDYLFFKILLYYINVKGMFLLSG